MDAESMLSSEIHDVTLVRDAIAAISAALVPATMFVLPVSGAMVHPDHALRMRLRSMRIMVLNRSYRPAMFAGRVPVLMAIIVPIIMPRVPIVVPIMPIATISMVAKRRNRDGKT